MLALIKEGSKALNSALRQTFDMVCYPGRMQRAEALKILNLGHGYTEKELVSNFNRFYSANAAANGGSVYLQRKIRSAFDIVKNDI